MDIVIAQMRNDAFAAHLGIDLVDVSPGKAKVSLSLKPEHCNSVGMVHGGVTFTVADYAFAAACNSHGTVAVAINCHISYLRPPRGQKLVAEAKEVSKSRRLGTYAVDVHDGEGNLVAVFQGMAYRKDDPLDAPGRD